MLRRTLSVLATLALLAATVPADEERPDSREEEARKDLQEMQGTWKLESLEDGKKTKVDVKKRTLFFGGELCLVRDGDKVVQVGVARLVTSKSPRRIDVVVRKGQHQDNTMLGIYEVKDDTLKVCFDPEGEGRPAAFATKLGPGIVARQTIWLGLAGLTTASSSHLKKSCCLAGALLVLARLPTMLWNSF